MLQIAEENTRKIEIASEAYRPGSVRSATLFFVLNDLAAVDPMYQFSLDAYVELFQISLAKSSRNEKIEERLSNIMDFHTYSTFKYTSRSGPLPSCAAASRSLSGLEACRHRTRPVQSAVLQHCQYQPDEFWFAANIQH